MVKQYIFNHTLLIKFAGKCSGPHTKITNGIVFTEFFTIKNQNLFTDIFNT
jgi:hypothetical protein